MSYDPVPEGKGQPASGVIWEPADHGWVVNWSWRSWLFGFYWHKGCCGFDLGPFEATYVFRPKRVVELVVDREAFLKP